ncbi:MAG: GUN4 domain-containing protein [Leptolyngbya sp. SIO1E4]|nr:GUN4 domain-containing protein [Leptolyngbya sp. SIO1E4]
MTSPSGPPPPLNARLAEILLKAISTGGITVGGANAFWQLIKQDGSIPKAIASAVIGLGIACGAKLLQPIHQGNEKRLQAAGEKINKTIDRTGERLTYGSFEDWYLQCQAWDCQSYRPEGMAQHDGIFTPLLEEVFVPLGLDLSATLPGFKMPSRTLTIQELEQTQNLNIWHFIRKAEQTRPFRQLAILAWGGYGKTTLLKHITYTYGTQQQERFQVPKRIPILLVLRKYRDLLAQENPPSLPELITKHHIPSLPKEGDERTAPANWANNLLRRGNAVVMLDGFDEVAKDQRPAIAQWINAQMRRYGNSIFIVTSRPKAYKEQDAADRLELSTALWVRDFNDSQRRDFVTRWYQCQEKYAHGGRDTPDVRQLAANSANDLLGQIEARQELKDLAKNPLLLNMIVTFHRRYPGARLPQRRVELYREICLLQLRDRPRARKLDTLLTQCEAQSILQQVAWGMMKQRWELIKRPNLLSGLKKILKQQSESIEAKDFLEQVVQISELLVEQEDEIEFAHLSFQEYLAAAEIARTQKESDLYNRFDDDWWKPTILLYAAQVNPTRLIRKMLELGATDLAYACWQDTTKRLDPDLAAELEGLQPAVTTSRYQKLEDYLKNGQWKEADQETYRLMITAVGKDVGQIFEPEELLVFPRDELKAIDGLWVKHSNGKFGFSVQKDLYLNQCGGILDGKYHEEAFSNLFKVVGWRRIKYGIASPYGHLPWGMFGGVVGGFGLGVSVSLLSHPGL